MIFFYLLRSAGSACLFKPPGYNPDQLYLINFNITVITNAKQTAGVQLIPTKTI